MVYARTRARIHIRWRAGERGPLSGVKAFLTGRTYIYIYIFIRRGLFRWRARFHDYGGGRTLCRNRSHRKVQSLGRVYTYIIYMYIYIHTRTRITATRTRCTHTSPLTFSVCCIRVYIYILYNHHTTATTTGHTRALYVRLGVVDGFSWVEWWRNSISRPRAITHE